MTASVQLAFNTAAAYDYLVTNHGSPIALLRPPWYVCILPLVFSLIHLPPGQDIRSELPVSNLLTIALL